VPLLNELALGDVSPKIKEDIKNAALIELQKLYAEKCADLPGVGTALLEGDPARALADFAVSQNADLLVVGSTGLSGLAKAMFGSVAAKVVQKAPCSVLVVRRKK
jgi:nucleotide-binding universal stress UspA family protein